MSLGKGDNYPWYPKGKKGHYYLVEHSFGQNWTLVGYFHGELEVIIQSVCGKT